MTKEMEHRDNREYCQDHSGLKGRINLVIALLLACISGVAALLALSITMHLSLRADLAAQTSLVMVQAEKMRNLESETRDIKHRLKILEIEVTKFGNQGGSG